MNSAGCARVEVRRLARVHHRAAAHRDVAVEAALGGEARGVLERGVGRLDHHRIVDCRIDMRRRERALHRGRVLARLQARVGEKRNALEPELARVLAGFGQHARAERERRHPDGKAAVASLDGGEIGVTARHRSFSGNRVGAFYRERIGDGGESRGRARAPWARRMRQTFRQSGPSIGWSTLSAIAETSAWISSGVKCSDNR